MKSSVFGLKASLPVFSVITAVLGLGMAPSSAQELTGFASLDSNAYTLLNRSRQKFMQFSQNELENVLLLEDQGVVQDIFRRVTWFDADGIKRVDSVPGSEFKVTGDRLATYSKNWYARIHAADGRTVFETERPISGVGLAQNRFALIDSWQKTLYLYNRDAKLLRQWVGVQNAWLSQKFLGMRFYGGGFQLFGEGMKMFPVDAPDSLSPNAFQISDDLAVMHFKDGRVRVYGPQGFLFQRMGINRVILTQNYLALSDVYGLEWISPKGVSIGRSLIGDSLKCSNTACAVYLPGQQLRLIRLVTGTDGVSRIQQSMVTRAQTFIMGVHQALVWNSGWFEAISLKEADFGTRRYQGSAVYDPAPIFTVGLKTVGWVNPKARNAQIYGNSSGNSSGSPLIFDQMFVNRLDLPVEAPALNWMMF
jgi:hypothetical protein